MATISPHDIAPSGIPGSSALEQLAARPARARLPQRRFAVGGLVIAAALLYLIVSSFGSAISSVVSPGQLLGHGNVMYGQQVRLQGVVVGSDRQDAATLAHTFTVSGGGRAVTVVYGSDLPGGFKTGAQVEAQGTYDGHTFAATSLTAKCPTKYQAAPTSG